MNVDIRCDDNAGKQPEGLSMAGLLTRAAVGGFVAGMSFLAFTMAAALLMHKEILFFLRMAAALVLGRDALYPWYSLFEAALVGLFMHLLLSMLFGLLFGAAIGKTMFRAAADAFRFVRAGVIFGGLLWIANYFVVAPLFGWNWFPLQGFSLVFGFVGHCLFFGPVLGYYLKHPLHRRPEYA